MTPKRICSISSPWKNISFRKRPSVPCKRYWEQWCFQNNRQKTYYKSPLKQECIWLLLLSRGKKIIKSSSKLRHLLSFPCLLSTVWNVLLIHKNCCSLENTWFYACSCVIYIKTYKASFRKHKIPGNYHESLLLILYMQFVVPLWIFILFSKGIAWKKKKN